MIVEWYGVKIALLMAFNVGVPVWWITRSRYKRASAFQINNVSGIKL